MEWAAPCPRQPRTHIDVLLPSMLGADLGILYEVQVSPPHGNGRVATERVGREENKEACQHSARKSNGA